MENSALQHRLPKFVALVGRDWHLVREWVGEFG